MSNFGDAMASGLAAVGGTAEKIGLDGVRSAIEEARAERLAEIASQIKMRDEDTLRTRNKDDATEERARVDTEARGIADKDSAGLIFSARSQYENSSLSPEDKAAGLAAVGEAEKSGAYKRDPTNYERLIAAGKYAEAESVKNLETDNSLRERTFDAETENRKKQGERADKELTLRERELGRGAELRAVQLEQAQLQLDALKRETKIPPAVKATAEVLRDEIKMINKTIYDAEAMNTLTPEGQVALSKRAADLANKVSKLYEPYMPEGVKAEKEAPGPAIKYDKDGKPWTKDASGKVVPYVEKKAEPARAETPPAQTAKPAESAPTVTNMERAGTGLMGGKKFVATYSDGTKKVISGDEAERQFILMSK